MVGDYSLDSDKPLAERAERPKTMEWHFKPATRAELLLAQYTSDDDVHQWVNLCGSVRACVAILGFMPELVEEMFVKYVQLRPLLHSF